MDNIDKKLSHSPISIAEFGLNRHITPTDIPMDVRVSTFFLIHNEIKYRIIIIPARTLEGVNPTINTKNITKIAVSTQEILSLIFKDIKNLNTKNATIEM